MSKYKVTVGNIGNIDAGDDLSQAMSMFNDYVSQSKSKSGRASGEDVILFDVDEIVKEYDGVKESVDVESLIDEQLALVEDESADIILKKLYNSIMNDGSIQHYTMGWKDVTNAIKKKYNSIPKDDTQFGNSLVVKAVSASSEPLKSIILSFARELDINTQTLADKYK